MPTLMPRERALSNHENALLLTIFAIPKLPCPMRGLTIGMRSTALDVGRSNSAEGGAHWVSARTKARVARLRAFS